MLSMAYAIHQTGNGFYVPILILCRLMEQYARKQNANQDSATVSTGCWLYKTGHFSFFECLDS